MICQRHDTDLESLTSKFARKAEASEFAMMRSAVVTQHSGGMRRLIAPNPGSRQPMPNATVAVPRAQPCKLSMVYGLKIASTWLPSEFPKAVFLEVVA